MSTEYALVLGGKNLNVDRQEEEDKLQIETDI